MEIKLTEEQVSGILKMAMSAAEKMMAADGWIIPIVHLMPSNRVYTCPASYMNSTEEKHAFYAHVREEAEKEDDAYAMLVNDVYKLVDADDKAIDALFNAGHTFSVVQLDRMGLGRKVEALKVMVETRTKTYTLERQYTREGEDGEKVVFGETERHDFDRIEGYCTIFHPAETRAACTLPAFDN